MPAANYLAGKNAYLNLGGASMRFAKWKIPLKTNTVKRTNFLSQGFRELLACIAEGDATVSGPYDAGNMAITSGTTVSVVFGLSALLNLTATCIVGEIGMEQDVEGAADISVSLQTTGSFSISVT